MFWLSCLIIAGIILILGKIGFLIGFLIGLAFWAGKLLIIRFNKPKTPSKKSLTMFLIISGFTTIITVLILGVVLGISLGWDLGIGIITGGLLAGGKFSIEILTKSFLEG